MKDPVDYSLVEQYAPILHFHPAEGDFCCYPCDAEVTYHLFKDDWSKFEVDMSPNELDPNTPCYYEVWDDLSMIQIRYWFWYKYNKFPNAPFGKGQHLGDWEHVEVRIYKNADVTIWLLSNHLSARLTALPSGYTLPNFAYESGIITDNHVHAVVALGSHAHYPSFDSKPYCAARIFCDKFKEGGLDWYTENNLVPIHETNFFSYTGRWGDKDAPRSPTNEYNNRERNAPLVAPLRDTEK
ncbi:MAG: hypothetical protein BAJATHORv1_70045 [Candidatus Thorarchaeota archaeon]|nr:MAG: hypothetical protein BAJATHORv1_70045 [Candidatus Thorarchaeota archaeon]